MSDDKMVIALKKKIRTLEKEVLERKKWLQELHEKDSQLKAMVEAFDGLIYVCSPDYRVEYINENYIRRIGYDATGQTCYKALHYRDTICPWCLNRRIFEGETVRCEVLSHKNKWYNVVSTPIFHSDGSVSKHAMIIDVTDRKHAEISLQKKVDEQELLLDNIHTQIWYLTDEKTYGAINKAHAEFLGLHHHNIEGKTLYDVLSREKADIFVSYNTKVFQQKTKLHIEEWIINGKGENRLLSINETPKLDDKGNVEYVVCSGDDITDYRNSEKNLQQSIKRLRLAMEATSDALWDWDLSTNKVFFNANYYTMLEYEPYEMPQNFETWKELIHPEDKTLALEKIQKTVKDKLESIKLEYRLKTKQGDWRWILARGKVVDRIEDGTPVRIIGTHVDITDRKLSEEALRLSEAHLREENLRLRSSFKGANQFCNIVGKSKIMQDVYEIILKAALSSANVIIYGESGTGKELVAQTIHDLSSRGSKNFVTVNCGAIPDNLIESEFFGYKKGAFTGADLDKPGYLDFSDSGTLFMDEIGELDLNMQVKLLRAIDGGGFTPIGSREIKIPDIRIIAATNRDLKECLLKGEMREDFYYRIHIIPVQLPPLRKRREDISLLIHHFLQTYGDEKNVPSIPAHIIKAMQGYDWPGNVRELQNAVHRYITLKEIDFMDESVTGPESQKLPSSQILIQNNEKVQLRDIVRKVEKKYIEQLLNDYQWHRSKVAKILGINRRTLFRKMREYEIQ